MKSPNSNRTRFMMRGSLVRLLLILSLAAIAGQAQSVARVDQLVDQKTNFENAQTARRAIAALKRLEANVIVYPSLSQFEADGRLARVTLRTFDVELAQVNNELDLLLARVPAGKLRTEISNALASYRDGLFWWRQIDQTRVVHVSALTSSAARRSPAEANYMSTIPYTVAIHWRQAQKYLNQAEKTIGR